MSLVGDTSPEQNFPRAARLLSAREFDRVFSKAVRVSNKYFTVLLRPNTEASARIGFVISKKNINLAVQRNLVRRKSREFFRMHRMLIPAIDMVFIARPSLSKANRKQIHQALENLWHKIESHAKNTNSAD